MTKNNKGRGLFASRFLKKGELLIAEKPLAFARAKDNMPPSLSTDCTYTSLSKQALIKKCAEKAALKGVDAVRLSHLFYDPDQELKIPTMDIFISNEYK